MAKKDVSRIIILFGVALLLAAVAFVVPKIVKRFEKDPDRSKLFILDEDKATKFNLKYNGNDFTVLKEKDGKWYLTTPARYRADEMEAQATIKNFNTLHFARLITDDIDLEAWGLEAPCWTFSVYEGGRGYTVEVGSNTFDGAHYYARYGDEVFVISEDYILALHKTITELRDKNFLDVHVANIVGATINNDLSFRKTGRTEAVCNSIETNLDVNKALTLLQTIGMIRATEFIPENANPRNYGFTPGDIFVTVDLIDGTSRSFYVTKLRETTYAKRADNDAVYEIDAFFFDELSAPRSAYLLTENATNSADAFRYDPDARPEQELLIRPSAE